jgi:hypothetical protein
MERVRLVALTVLLSIGTATGALAQANDPNPSVSQPPTQENKGGTATPGTGDPDGGVSGYSGGGAGGTSLAPGTRTPDTANNDPGQRTGLPGTGVNGTATTNPSAALKPTAPQVSGPNRN